MNRWTWKKDPRWEGGQIRVGPDGTHYPYIQRMINSLRFALQLAPEDPESLRYLEDAKLELKLFMRDPIGYKRAHDVKMGRLSGTAVICQASLQKYVDDLCDRGRNRHHIKNYVRHLGAWGQAFGGKDLRFISPAQLEGYRWPTAMNARRRALRAFCNWLIRREQLRIEESPARRLEIPKERTAKASKRMGYSTAHVERFYAAVRSQDIRDVLLMRAKYGVHHTDLARLIEGGTVKEIHHPCGIAAVVAFIHKSGDEHKLSIDAQALAAVRRLQKRGFVPSKEWTLKLCHKTAEQNGIPTVLPEELRHSFASWMEEGGKKVTRQGSGLSRAEIGALMGHKSLAMVDRYVDLDVPPMAIAPIHLVHPEDPPIPDETRRKPRLVAV